MRLEITRSRAERLYVLYALSSLVFSYGMDFLPSPSSRLYLYSSYLNLEDRLSELFKRVSTLGIWKMEYENLFGKKISLEVDKEIFDYHYASAIERVHGDFEVVGEGGDVGIELVYEGEVYF